MPPEISQPGAGCPTDLFGRVWKKLAANSMANVELLDVDGRLRRYQLLLEIQALLVPERVRELLSFGPSGF